MTEERNVTYLTREEIIAFITAVSNSNPDDTFLDRAIIEDGYIFLPSCEFVKNPSTGQWKPL